MTWLLAPAFAAPTLLTLSGEPVALSQPEFVAVRPDQSGSRYAVEGVVASGLVWERLDWACDGDEWALGDHRSRPDGRQAPRWCQAAAERLEVHALQVDLSELDRLLSPLDPVRRVWAHGFWESQGAGREPCWAPAYVPNAPFTDLAGGTRFRVSDDASVQVGLLTAAGESDCPVTYGPRGYGLSECEPGWAEVSRATLWLFDFAEEPQCTGADADWAVRVDLGLGPGPSPLAAPGPALVSVDDSDAGWGWINWALLVLFLLTSGLFVGIYMGAIGMGRRLRDLWPSTLRGPGRVETERAEPAVDFARALSRQIRKDWALVYKEQDQTLKGLAMRREDYLRSMDGNVESVVLAEPFDRTRRQAQWQSLLDEMAVVDIRVWSDDVRKAAACLVVATMRVEADAFRKGLRARQNKPAANGVLLAVLVQVAGYRRSRLASLVGDRHPAVRLALMVREAVDDLPPPRRSVAHRPTPIPPPEPAPRAEREEIERLRQQLDHREQQLRAMESGVAHSAAKEKARRKAAEARVSELEAQLERHRVAREVAAEDVTLLKQRVADLESHLAQPAPAQEDPGRIAQLEAKLAELKEHYRAAYHQWEEEARRRAELEAQLGQPTQAQPTTQAPSASRDQEDGRFLLRAIGQVLAMPALRASAVEVALVVESRFAPEALELLRSSRELRASAEVGDLQKQPRYTAEWRALEESLHEGLVLAQAFAAGASRLAEGADYRTVLDALVREVPQYGLSAPGTAPDGWHDGFRAWDVLYPKPRSKPTDEGRAIAEALRFRVIERSVVPWLRLLQFLTEALPVEVPGRVGNVGETLGDAAAVAEVFEALDQRYEHVPLYRSDRRAFSTRRSEVAFRLAPADAVLFGLEAPPDARPGVVVRVHWPILDPNRSRAELVGLDLE